jgi:hypothetical protein
VRVPGTANVHRISINCLLSTFHFFFKFSNMMQNDEKKCQIMFKQLNYLPSTKLITFS